MLKLIQLCYKLLCIFVRIISIGSLAGFITRVKAENLVYWIRSASFRSKHLYIEQYEDVQCNNYNFLAFSGEVFPRNPDALVKLLVRTRRITWNLAVLLYMNYHKYMGYGSVVHKLFIWFWVSPNIMIILTMSVVSLQPQTLLQNRNKLKFHCFHWVH